MTTFHLEGVGELPNAAQFDLRDARSKGWQVYQKSGSDTHPGECSNCGSMGKFIFLFCPGEFDDENKRAAWMIPGEGMQYRNVSGQVKTYPCPVCTVKPTIEQLRAGCGVSELDWRFTFDFFNGRTAGKEKAISYAHATIATMPCPTGWITLWGDYGVGKSALIKMTTRAAALSGLACKYVLALDILENIKSHFGKDGTLQAINHWKSYRFLAIDEINRLSTNDWSQATLMSILNSRYDNRLRCSTMIALNVNPAKLAEPWCYLASRMTDGEIINVTGECLRG